MTMAVNVLCRSPQEDRVIPRFSRYLADHLGWTLTAKPVAGADAYYLSGYFEHGLLKHWPDRPVAAYFTHREEEPPGNAKARLFDDLANRLDLRIATCALYAEYLSAYGPTVQITPPVERERFTIPNKRNTRPVAAPLRLAGFSGYTYPNRRKGEDLARAVIGSKPGRSLQWKASGRGWPVATQRYPWSEMPAFYQSLDVLVVVARVEGVPMPPLEALACGVSIVIPIGVGLLDDLPDLPGIHRYRAGDAQDCLRALAVSMETRGQVDRERLRAVTEPYTITAWCEQHRQAFEKLCYGDRFMLEQSLIAEDDQILADVRHAYSEVDTVLAWTRKHIPYIKRQVAPYQGAILAYYAHRYNRTGARFLEIGTAIGYSACLMATAAPRAQITTLNPKEGEFEKARDNLRIRSNAQVVKSTSQEFWHNRNGQLYDFIFVDGDHAYNMVLHDSQLFNCLRPGGLILFHDYSPDGSARPSDGSFRALNDLQDRHRQADVKVIGSGGVGMLGWIRAEGEIWT
jgi:predicted O-methyltransferase YrrM/glycosyltransferase involved in cell wall biosynthesis